MGTRGALLLAGLGATAVLAVAWWAFARSPAGVPAASLPQHAAAGAGLVEAQLIDPDAAPDARSASAERELAAAPRGPRLVGRVLDDRDGRGLPGAWLVLWRAARPDEDAPEGVRLAETGSAPDGSFAFELEVVPGSRVRAEPPYGWVLLEPERAAAAPLEFRARPIRRAPLRAELVDRETGEPVPEARLAVRAASGGGLLELTSDARGACESELDFEEGELQAVLVQEAISGADPRGWRPPIPSIDHAGDPSAAPIALPVAVGPTVRLDLRLPAGLELDMLHALILPPGESSLAREDAAARVRVRADPGGGPPWVRFLWDPVLVLSGRPGPCTLVVRDNARSWRGAAPLPPAWGVHPGVVTVALAAAAALEVEVLGGDGVPVQGAQVALGRVEGGSATSARSGVPGEVRFAGLPAGEYTLAVAHRDFVAHERVVRVAPGSAERVRVVLERATAGGSISGRVRAGPRLRRLADKRTIVVMLVSREDGSRSFGLPLVWEQDGDRSWTAEFRFEEVPAGTYVCQLWPGDARCMWPQLIEVAPPASGLVFAELEEGALLPLRLAATDAEDGSPLEDAWMWVHGEGAIPVERDAEGAGSPFLPPDAELDWAVGAPGHAPRFGGRSALRVEEGVLTATVALARGFGLRLLATDSAGTPLAGVAVRLDGAPAGSTDAEGRLLLGGDSVPSALQLEHLRWREPEDLAQLFARAAAQGRPQLTLALRPR